MDEYGFVVDEMEDADQATGRAAERARQLVDGGFSGSPGFDPDHGAGRMWRSRRRRRWDTGR